MVLKIAIWLFITPNTSAYAHNFAKKLVVILILLENPPSHPPNSSCTTPPHIRGLPRQEPSVFSLAHAMQSFSHLIRLTTCPTAALWEYCAQWINSYLFEGDLPGGMIRNLTILHFAVFSKPILEITREKITTKMVNSHLIRLTTYPTAALWEYCALWINSYLFEGDLRGGMVRNLTIFHFAVFPKPILEITREKITTKMVNLDAFSGYNQIQMHEDD